MWHQLIYRFEKFSVHSKYSRAKVFGTILCLGGAIAMSFSMNPPSEPDSTLKLTSRSVSKEWILGCLFLLFAIIILSSNTVLLVCIFCRHARTHANCILRVRIDQSRCFTCELYRLQPWLTFQLRSLCVLSLHWWARSL